MFTIWVDTLMGSVKQEIWSPILNLLDKKYEAKKHMTPALNKQGRFIEFGSINRFLYGSNLERYTRLKKHMTPALNKQGRFIEFESINRFLYGSNLERYTRLELVTPTLARSCSTN